MGTLNLMVSYLDFILYIEKQLKKLYQIGVWVLPSAGM